MKEVNRLDSSLEALSTTPAMRNTVSESQAAVCQCVPGHSPVSEMTFDRSSYIFIFIKSKLLSLKVLLNILYVLEKVRNKRRILAGLLIMLQLSLLSAHTFLYFLTNVPLQRHTSAINLVYQQFRNNLWKLLTRNM